MEIQVPSDNWPSILHDAMLRNSGDVFGAFADLTEGITFDDIDSDIFDEALQLALSESQSS